MKKATSIVLMIIFCISCSIPADAKKEPSIEPVRHLNVLETENLKILRATDDDVKVLAKYFDINVRYYYLCSDVDMTEDEAFDYLKLRNSNDEIFVFVIRDKEDNPMGEIELFYKEKERSFYVGYWIAQPFWGKGYATESCCELISEIGKIVPNAGFVIELNCKNHRSKRAAEKITNYLCGNLRNLNETDAENIHYKVRREGPRKIRYKISKERTSKQYGAILDFAKYVDGKLDFCGTYRKSVVMLCTYKSIFDTGELEIEEFAYYITPIKN